MTDHDTQEVGGCGLCPFMDREWLECEHLSVAPSQARTTYFLDPQPPDWCPLRTRPVLVRLVAKESK